MNLHLVIDLAIVGTHAKNKTWFRQREVRAIAEVLLDWSAGVGTDRVGLHNTQILRRLENLVCKHQAIKEVSDNPSYKLTNETPQALLENSAQHAIGTDNFQEFLLVHYFFNSHRILMSKMPVLNSRQLVSERLKYLEKLEEYWVAKMAKNEGLIAGDRIKKIDSPTIDWIQYQKKILSSKFTPD